MEEKRPEEVVSEQISEPVAVEPIPQEPVKEEPKTMSMPVIVEERPKLSLWRRFRNGLERVGTVQSKILLTAIYFIVFLIPGVAVAIFADKLRVKRRLVSWDDRKEEPATLESSRDQW